MAYGLKLTGAVVARAEVARAAIAGVIAEVFLYLPVFNLSVIAFLFDCMFFLCSYPTLVITLLIRFNVRSIMTTSLMGGKVYDMPVSNSLLSYMSSTYSLIIVI